MTTLYVVLTDYNGTVQTRRCLEALRASTSTNFGVIVVDHGTDGETCRLIETEFPGTLRVPGSPELWWAGAINLGIRTALARGAEYILLLNNDCYVQPETISDLEILAKQNPGSIVAPVQRDLQTNEILPYKLTTCLTLGFPTIMSPRSLLKKKQERELVRVGIIVGGRGVIIPAVIFRRVGLFNDSSFPHYAADHDFFLRARGQNIKLEIAVGCVVVVDSARTSRAVRPENLTLKQFRKTLHDRRSHRNMHAVKTLLRSHYPLKRIHGVGFALYLVRYFIVYTGRRFWREIRRNS